MYSDNTRGFRLEGTLSARLKRLCDVCDGLLSQHQRKTFPVSPSSPPSPPEVNCDVCLLSVSANAGELPDPDGEAEHGRSSQLERDRCSPSDSDLSVEQEDRDVFSDY